MRYRKPFTPDQRRNAAKVYRSYRENYKRLRVAYAPQDRAQRTLLRDYRDIIREFGEEVAKPVRAVDADLLNLLERQAFVTLASYFAKRMKGRTQ
jgi:hypothetical protein